MKRTTSLFVTLAATTCASAQGGLQDLVALDAIFPVPIHTSAPDPVYGEYGHWTAGADYKASFGRTFTFYPLLGSSYPENLPVAWTTTSVDAGGTVWLEASPEPAVDHTDFRWRTRHAGFVERYDVRDEGIEQSFVLEHAPPRGGDVVIRGAIETALSAQPRGAKHAPIEFHDHAGRPIVSYGEAFAIDARGRRIDVPASYDGDAIALHVPGSWLATAAFPVTVDPLLSRVLLEAYFGSVTVLDSDQTTSHQTTNGRLLVVHSREFSGNDNDAFGTSANTDFSSPTTIWTDTASFDTNRPRCAWSPSANDWVIAFERATGSIASVRCYTHDDSSTIVNSGTYSFLSQPSGYNRGRPDICGLDSVTSSSALLLVFEEYSQTASSDSDVLGTTFSLPGSFGTAFSLGGASLFVERRRPSLPTIINPNVTIPVVWQQRSNFIPNASWGAYLGHVDRFATSGSVYPPVSVGSSSANTQSLTPMIDGNTNHMIVAYTASSTGLRSIEHRRVTWSEVGSPSIQSARTLSTGTLLTAPTLDGIAFDYRTDSHWCLVHRRNNSMFATRVGWTGGTLEQATVQTDPLIRAGSVSYARYIGPGVGAGTFQTVHSDGGLLLPLYGNQFLYGDATWISSGPSCGNGALTPRGFPVAGNGLFGLLGYNMPPNTFVYFLLTFGPTAQIPLPDAPGCNLLIDPNLVFTVAALFTNSNGQAVAPLALPDDPVWTGDFNTQCIWLEPSLNPLGAGVTSRLHVEVR